MKILKQYPLLLLFAAFILLVSVADMLTPVRSDSEMENRPLEQQPKISWKSLIAEEDNQKYSIKYEKYINDQFVGRDGWITLKSISESVLGKLENNGIVYGGDHHMFEKYTVTDDWRLEKNASFLSEFITKYQDKFPISFCLLPSGYAIYPELLPAQLANVDQKKYIEKIYASLPETTVRFDAFPALTDSKDEYIYYRTDHHWTTQGAYRVYQAFLSTLGRPVADLNELAALERTTGDFYGTYYSKSKLFSAVPDTISYYDLPMDSILVDGVEKPSLYQDAKWNERDKYAAFLWGNNGLTVLKSQNNRGHEQGKTSRVLLIKDSYGNCFAPFLTYSYDEVYVVDLRSISKISEVMESVVFDDVLVMYSFTNFSTDTNLARLTY